MISLGSFLVKFERRTETLGAAFERLAAIRGGLRKSDRFALQEGLVSHLWQSWSNFSRSVILNSLKGTTSVSGVVISSGYSARSIDEIRFAAMKAARNQSPGVLRPIGGDHLEPTWGDLSKFNSIVTQLNPSNDRQLLSAFGSAVLIPDLQTVRNACAHVSEQRIIDIRAIQVRYIQNHFLHPSDAIFWVDPITNDFSWLSWVDEMKLAATTAVA